MKKVIIILLIIILLLGLGVFFLMRLQQNKGTSNNILTPTQTQISSPIIDTSPSPVPTVNPTVVKLQQEQTQADYNYAVKQEETFKSFPWLSKLPIQNDNYFVYYDTDQNKFFGQLYTAENQDILKQEAIQKLRDLGVEMEKYEIIWQQL